ncbi:hypothetical protein QNN00_18475 [Bacillus velezensis]|nr:hypothetical protein [Bacillus velezensis]
MDGTRQIREALELWVKGLNVDWAKLYGDRPPKRMSLPSYPFAKDRYWAAKAPENTKKQALYLPENKTRFIRFCTEILQTLQNSGSVQSIQEKNFTLRTML